MALDVSTGLARIAVLPLALLLHGAAPAPSGNLNVDFTQPSSNTRVPWGGQASYAVDVSYAGKSTKFGEIPGKFVVVRSSYAADGSGPIAGVLPEGLVQIAQSNCTGCHDFEASSAGPSFAAIAKRYSGHASATATLAAHIRNGSSGSWGGNMPPHPDMTPAQATAVAQWILTEGGDGAVHYHVGRSGSFRMSAPGKPAAHAAVVLSGYYAGPLKPGDGRKAAGGRSVVVVHGS